MEGATSSLGGLRYGMGVRNRVGIEGVRRLAPLGGGVGSPGRGRMAEHRYFRRLLPLFLFFVGPFRRRRLYGVDGGGHRSAIAEAVPQDAGNAGEIVGGRIASAPQMDGDRLRFILEVRSLAVEGEHLLSIAGERVSARVMLKRSDQDLPKAEKGNGTDGSRHPGTPLFPARNPGGFITAATCTGRGFIGQPGSTDCHG